MPTDAQRFAAACDYPGSLDAAGVERELDRYLKALGVKRDVRRLDADWSVFEEPSLLRSANWILDDCVKRNPSARAALDARDARAARAALDARDARDALDARDARDARAALDADAPRRFASWCIQSGGWWWWREISWLATTYLGALQINKPDVVRWSLPFFEAYISGAWILHWTQDTLFWVAKPRVHVEVVNGRRRLHHESYAAVESDVENLYFWHGVMVPAHLVVRPGWITVREIDGERNAEVRRIMVERFGMERFLLESEAALIHTDETGALYRRELADDEPIVAVHVVNSTPEPDGSTKKYMLRVHHELRPLLGDGRMGEPQEMTARNAVASTFGLRGDEYWPGFES